MKLTTNKIKHSFGSKPILKNAIIACEQGKIVGIFGRNGTGKSTLLKLLFRALKSSDVILTIDDRSFTQKEIIPKKMIAYLPQHSFLPLHLKVRDLIPIYFEDGDAQNIVFYAPNMASLHNKTVKMLSMGERRYLELLLVLNLPHPFILLDEPFSMIEPRYIEIIKEAILQTKEVKGIIISDHYYKDVLSISDHLFLLKEGKLTSVESEDDLRTQGYLPQ